MDKRKSITKRKRFEVFKRDDFTCQYCGNKPPATVLEIDHIVPVSEGGKNDEDNLITSCFDCNRGKSNLKIEDKIAHFKNIEYLKEKEEQIIQYNLFVREKEKRIQKEIKSITEIYEEQYPEYTFSNSFKNGTLRKFLGKLSVHDVMDSLYIAIDKFPNDDARVIKYFCGICWRKIRGED